MLAKTHDDINRIYDTVETVKRLSDRIIGIGPINIIGLDGILALLPIPGLSTVYSVGAGLILLTQGLRARVTAGTLATSLVILLIDSGLTTVEDVVKMIPGAGALLGLIPGGIDAIFQGHLYAAHLIQKDIKLTTYVEGTAADAMRDGSHQGHVADMRATKGKKRIVYLG
ncbi:DUF4112 domain-containing protein [Asticcacaulis benevestitus]|uniref:DUF4112 domain-containing protein n=1 Tax=Asticcacaulis benevestitus DSM 16100 = ATCC BAA-896 TaxID=1121022 RepID=V4RED6_9CAUL|nr:DUF4112 domain-containing protein [Asticcacaulis benevestitus]ESQ89748.1 hypothetical protein ABENE_13465 [Asticcacaulis benevestitus DSM 16100 = ATCC BAA-896]